MHGSAEVSLPYVGHRSAIVSTASPPKTSRVAASSKSGPAFLRPRMSWRSVPAYRACFADRPVTVRFALFTVWV